MSMNRDRGSLARVATFDAVLVGSGINTLTAGAVLARGGWHVCVLERSDRLGGAIRTEQDYTLTGFTHEVMSSWHPLFQGSAAYAELAEDLHGRGLEYVNTQLPTGTAFPDGSAMFLGGTSYAGASCRPINGVVSNGGATLTFIQQLANSTGYNVSITWCS